MEGSRLPWARVIFTQVAIYHHFRRSLVKDSPSAVRIGLFKRRWIVFWYPHSLDSLPNAMDGKFFIGYLLDFFTTFIFSFMALAIAFFLVVFSAWSSSGRLLLSDCLSFSCSAPSFSFSLLCFAFFHYFFYHLVLLQSCSFLPCEALPHVFFRVTKLSQSGSRGFKFSLKFCNMRAMLFFLLRQKAPSLGPAIRLTRFVREQLQLPSLV